MSDKKKVSIGLPVFNGNRFIKRALDSLLKQDYGKFELIISDNASTDTTLSICKEYAAGDKRISVYEQKQNIGSFANFNTVLRLARGEYFMWAADDDYWHPEFISSMVNELENHQEAGVSMCAVDRILDTGEFLDSIRFKNRDNPNNKGYFQMLKCITSIKKYNMFFSGLWRTNLLKQATISYEVPKFDRLLISQMALATRFRYVDQVFHIRTHHRQPSNVRLPNEKFNKMENKDKLVDIKILFALGKMICNSKIIPWYRKIYLPVALWRFEKLLLLLRIMQQIRKRVNPDTWDRLKKLKKTVFKS